MGKIFKRTLATIMVVLIVLTCAPLGGFVGMEWKSITISSKAASPIVVEDTTYGILDSNISAKKITLNDGFYFVSHQIDDDLNGKYNSIDQYGEGYAIVAEQGLTGCYLIGINGLVKAFTSSESPKLTLLEEYSQDFPYALYSVYNPDTQKYDVYNASTCEYYNYGLDEIVQGTDTIQLRKSEYCKNLTIVERDGKQGVIDNKGVMLYDPIYTGIFGFKNCIMGTVVSEHTNEYGGISEDWKCAILSNDGTSSQEKFYKDYRCYNTSEGTDTCNEIIFAVSMDRNYFAAISTKNLSLLTDYKYEFEADNSSHINSSGFAEYKGHYYVIGYYTETYVENGEDIEFTRQDIICDDDTIWNPCNKFQGVLSSIGAYKNMLKIYVSTGYSISLGDVFGQHTTCYLVTPDGNNIEIVSTSENPSERMNSFRGFYGDLELRSNNSVLSTEQFYLVNNKNETIAENVDSKGIKIIGNYLIFSTNNNSKTQYCIYDIEKKQIALENVYIHRYIDWTRSKKKVLCVSETEESKKFGLFNLDNGSFSGYIFEGQNCLVTEFSGGDRKMWFCRLNTDWTGDSDEICYVNDKFKIVDISHKGIEVFGSNILLHIGEEEIEGIEYEKHILIDFDGNLIKEFYSDANPFYNTWYTNMDEYETYPIIDVQTGKQGLINTDGKMILGTQLDYVGGTYNGLTYVEPQKGKSSYYYDGFSGVVDMYGNALIYGKYNNFSRTAPWFGKSYYDVGRSGFFSLKRDNSLYIYDLRKCSGDYETPDSSIVTQDDLFGEYNSFLNNKYYSSICETAENDIVNTLSKQGHSAQVVSFAKSALSGGSGYVLNKLWNLLPFNSSDESKLQQELALEYLEHMDSGVMEDLVADVSKAKSLSKKIIKTQTEIKKLTESSKVSLAKTWKSEAFTESELYKFLTLVEKNEKTINAFFDKTGRTISVIDFIITYLTVCTIQQGVTERMMQLIDKNTDLYQGLKRINYQQKNGFYLAHVLVTDILSDECLGYVAGIAEKGVLELVTGKYASLVSIALSFAGKILASVIDAPDLKDTEKATMALANCASLKKAIKNYRTVIKNNYEQKGSLDVETLKTNYSLLCSSYFRALLTGLECARSVTDTRLEYDHITNTYYESNRRLIYRSYIRTCLLNARSSWEYTVQENKAVISKLNAAYPGNAGRVPLEELMEISADSSPDYTIDIPEKIDGYAVSEIGSGAFASDDKISGVYVSENVETIQSKAFDDCGSLTSLLLNDSVKTIENEALKDCSAIHSIDIPYSATNISSNFFTNEYTTITVNSSNESILSKFSDSDKIETQRKEAQLSKLEIISEPKVKKMNMQDEIETTGLKLKATYENGKTETVTEGYQCDIAERKVGSNTVTVYYKDLTADFDIEILESKCSYSIKYVDSKGNEISKEKTGTATAGSTITVKVPEIKGYIPVSEETKEKIGYKNEYTVHYEPSEKVSIEGAKVTVADQNFANKYLTPDIKVALNGQILEKDADYTVSYSNNYNPGIADVIVFGTGIYDGVALANFEIKSVAHAHSYTSKTTKAATYTATGVKTYTCSVCGDSYTKTIAKKSLSTTSSITATKTTSSITLKWNKVSGANGYRVYQKVNGSWKALAYTTNLTYTIKSLKANTKYEFAVRAYVLDGKTKVLAPKYKSVSATTSKSGLGTTSKITASKTSSTVKLTWNKVSGATGYRVYQKTSSGWKTLANTTNLTYTIKSLKANTSYTFAIRAYVTKSGKTTLAPKYKSIAVTTAKASSSKPAQVKNVKANPTATTVKLTWSKVSGVKGYEVFSYNSKTKKYTSLGKTTGTTYTVKKLKSNTAYSYAVQAYKVSGKKNVYGKASSVVKVTTLLAAPTVKISSTKGKANLTWNNIAGESGYAIYMATSKNGKYTHLANYKANSTKATKSKLKSGKTYYFKVRAYKKANGKTTYGAYSAVKSVKIK